MDIKLISKTNKPVLILGETGVGKSTLAKKIHELSKRNNLIHLNISSLNRNLIESELFGHQRGAFTGADSDKKGYFEQVGDGTLFIDEVGELSLDLQTKLLTVFDESHFFRVGATVPKRFKGRLIFATNKDLSKQVQLGHFREDLYFRMRFFEIRKPPLRNMPELLKIILNTAYDLSFDYNRQIKFDSDVLNCLINHSWPGNYRELQQTIEYLYILNKACIKQSDLPSWISRPVADKKVYNVFNYHDALSNFEKDFLTRAMIKHEGRVNKTSESIGLSKVTLISKLKKYGIDRRVFHNLREKEITYGF